MKVLHLMPYCPVPPIFGGALRIYHMLKTLAKDYDVTVVMFGDSNNEKNMRVAFDGQLEHLIVLPPPVSVKMRRLSQFYALWTKRSFFHLLGSSREMHHALNTIFSSRHFDLIFIEFPHMAGYDFPAKAIKILDSHNIEYEIYRQLWMNSRLSLRKLHYRQEFNNLYHYEVEVCRKQNAIFTTSEKDKEILDRHCPAIPKFVVPNGVDMAYFRPSNDLPDPYSLIFTGMMGYLPNYDGMEYFLDAIFPLIRKKIPQVKIAIVGSSPPQSLKRRASSNVTVTEYVPDVRPYIDQASVYVVPLRMGSGTRLKILEALAMKKPVVTTNAGCEGIDVVDGESALIADRPEDFADAVVRLLHDASLRKKISRNGNELAAMRYDWSVIGRQIDSIVQSLVIRKMRTPRMIADQELLPF